MNLRKETKDPTVHLTFTSAAIPSLCIAIWLLACSLVQAQSIHPYRTPQAIGLTSQLSARSLDSGAALNIPLLDWVELVATRDQIPMWIDRRIPSDRSIAMEIPKVQSHRDVLKLVASHLESEIAYVDSYIAMVPQGTAQALEWAYWTLMSQPSDTSLRAMRKEMLAWNDGSETRQIWKSFSDRNGLSALQSVGGLATQIDRWRGMRLESTNVASAATLLLSGFDQRLTWPADTAPRIEGLLESYRAFVEASGGGSVRFQYSSEIPKIGKENWQNWKSRWPKATVERASANDAGQEAWIITASVAAHRELVESLAPVAKPKPNTGTANPGLANKKYSGRYRGEIQKILENLSQQLSLQLVSQDIPYQLARQEVDVSFKDATLEQVLAKLSEASKLRISLEGQSITVRTTDK